MVNASKNHFHWPVNDSGAQIRNWLLARAWHLTWYGVDQKKVNFDLDQLERCSLLHGVQHVSNNSFTVFFDIAKF